MILQLLSRANSRELNGVATSFNSVITKAAPTDAPLLKLNTTLKTDNNNLTDTMTRKLGSDLTDHVWQLEGLRDNGLKSFFLTIEGCTFRLTKAIADAGSLILGVIKRHGRTMYNLAHAEQTSAMEAMFQELSSPAMVSALQTTSTTVIIEETKKAHQDFLDSLDERTEKKATKEDKILMVNVRKPVKNDLEKIMNYLNSVTPSEDSKLNTIYASLNEIITQANSNIRARITRAENEKKKEEPKK